MLMLRKPGRIRAWGRRAAAAVKTGEGRTGALTLGFSALILLTGLAAVMAAMALELHAGATAYIIGESHWSKAQQDAVASLYRYAQSGQADDLRRAREALQVPLGDRSARMALDQPMPDEQAARAGFLQGGNATEDISRLIWTYRHFADAPYFRDAVRTWREAEPDVLTLQRLGDHMETLWQAQPPTPAQVAQLRTRIRAADDRLRPRELAFSRALWLGAHRLRECLLFVGAVMFLLIAACAVKVMNWTLRRVRESDGIFRAAFHQATVGMLKLESNGRLVEVNDALCRIFGIPREQLVGRSILQLLHPDAVPALRPVDAGIDWDAVGSQVEHRFLRGDGSTLWGRCTVAKIDAGNRVRVFMFIEDVSEAHTLALEIEHQATHDDLTGLINRREIERRLQQVLDGARTSDSRHALCYLDLDQFKLVNDTCGHAVGDVLLRQLATMIQSQLRSTDWMGRLGGDEFAILLGDTPLHGAQRVAEKINALVAARNFTWEERVFEVTCSIGVVEVTSQAPDVGWLLRAADTACYLAKDEGRNRIRTFHESDAAVTRRIGQMEWIGEVRRAIAERRLLLYAQRIEALEGVSELQYEILVRLVDSDGRIYLPGAFLAAVEYYDQASMIDREVVAMVLEQLGAAPEHLRGLNLCHINLSAQSIADADFRRYVVGLLDGSPVPAEKLCFEVTETAVIGNLTEARLFIEEMHARGCRIALDDFGSGLSSFGYLKNLVVDIIKIDGVFVRDMVEDPIDAALVQSICQVGHTLGKRIIAEWAEDAAILALLREAGVDFAQGYAIHRPCPLDELIQRTASTNVAVRAPAV